MTAEVFITPSGAYFLSLGSKSWVYIQTNTFKDESKLQVLQYVEYAYWVKLTQEMLSEEQEMFSVYLFLNPPNKIIPVSISSFHKREVRVGEIQELPEWLCDYTEWTLVSLFS